MNLSDKLEKLELELAFLKNQLQYSDDKQANINAMVLERIIDDINNQETLRIEQYERIINQIKAFSPDIFNNTPEPSISDLTIKESRYFLDSILKIIPANIYIFDIVNRKNVYTNRQIVELLGYTNDEILKLGDSFYEKILHFESFKESKKFNKNIINLKDGEVATIEQHFISKSGESVFLETHETPFERDEENNITKILGFSIDVSELKRNRTKINDQNEELKKINSELNRLIVSISHDLRTPIHSAICLVELASLEDNEDLKNDYIKQIKDSLLQLDKQIIEILDISKGDGFNSKVEEINISHLFDQIFEEQKFHPNYSKLIKNITFSKNAPVHSYKKQLVVILRNIIANALKFLNPENRFHSIDIQVIQNAEYFSFEIADNGVGIKKSDLANVFKLHYKGSNSSGTGLGLFMVKETIEKLNGKISVESTEGQGTVFKFVLPNLIVSSVKAY